MFLGRIGGICYSEEGLEASLKEDPEVTKKRIDRTTAGEHQSVFEHVNIGMHLKNSTKMLNMVLNNEHQYSTSERSLRYTTVKEDCCNLSKREIMLYDKWYKIFYDLITQEYGNVLKPFKIKTLAKENARYMTSTFVNTEMVHTIPLAQLNRIVSYMKDYMNKENKDDFEQRVSKDFEMFIDQCEKLNVLDERLQSNRKQRSLEIFGKNLKDIPNEFGVTYSITYPGSFAEYAQKERHRKEDSCIERDESNGFFVPPLLELYPELMKQWLYDIETVRSEVPQGELVNIHEEGSLNKFILKLKERDCSAAQLEIFRQSKKTKEEYYKALKNYYKDKEDEEKEHPYAKKLEPYMGKRRCGFPDYNCPQPCGFREGIIGSRRI
jgi:thymidylate synthase ThyX